MTSLHQQRSYPLARAEAFAPTLVIPAKAGIQHLFLFRATSNQNQELDPGFRRDDELEPELDSSLRWNDELKGEANTIPTQPSP